jgi:pimeloyl-ACP methyl ester carboxylesterase
MHSFVNVFYVDLPGGNADSGRTLLLLHGFPTSSVDFKGPFLRALHPEFDRIIALDYPGAFVSPYMLMAMLVLHALAKRCCAHC